jgi:Ribose/xylose/arabinose/galactoside ABC-type transport systems, permease components
MTTLKSKEVFSSSQMIILYVIIGLCISIGLVNKTFFEFSTVITLSRAALVTLIFAICEMIIIISGGIDVSFPAIACAALYIPIEIMTKTGINNLAFAFGMAILIGLVFGAVNAVLIAQIKIPPLIATLGMSSVINGALLGIFGATENSRLPDTVEAVFKQYLFTYKSPQGLDYSLTILFIIPVILAVAVAILLYYTKLGRGIYAIGGNKKAAAIAGFNVKGIQYFVYIFVGGIVGVAAMISCILNRTASPTNLMGSEMMVIAAVVVGGTRITGGHGTILGTILGVYLIALIENNLIMIGVPTHWQAFILAILIIAGTAMTSIKAIRAAHVSKV